ncbi:MAG: polar amino acid transport system substrate-binding protein [Polaribacter sp.]|jgi:polar amino acid transport system substrate-binding protein
MNKLSQSLLILLTFIIVSCNQPEPVSNEPGEAIQESTEIVAETSMNVASMSDLKVTESCELVLGWDPWEPYQYLTPDNKVKGLDIELIQSMARQIDCNVKFEQGEWMVLLESLKSGEIDMLGGASKTLTREIFADFSDPYRDESFVLYLLNEEKEKYAEKSIYELMDDKFRLGITEDYIYGEAVANIQDNEIYQAQIVSVPVTEVNYYNLIQGNIDGFLEDPFVAGYTIKRKGYSSKIVASGIKVHSGDVSIMFSKVSVKPEMVEQFNVALDDIKDSGEYQKILGKYSH